MSDDTWIFVWQCVTLLGAFLFAFGSLGIYLLGEKKPKIKKLTKERNPTVKKAKKLK